MTTLRVWLVRVTGLFRSSVRDRALDDEIQAHLEELTDELVARGMPRTEAIAEAHRRFGGVDQVKELYRDQRGWPSADALRHDIVLALRQPLRQRGSTSLAVLSLGVGIGVSMAFFTIVNAICFRGLPIDRPEDVLFLGTRDREAKQAGLSYADFLDLRREASSFEGVAAYTAASFNVADGRGVAGRVSGSYVSAGAFHVLGVEPVIGREFGPADDIGGAPTVVVLGHAVWLSRYGGDPAVIGRSIRVNGWPAVIVGVMPGGFRFPGQADAWMPLAAMPGIATQSRSIRNLAAFARVAAAAGPVGAHEELSSLARDLESRYPDTNGGIDISTVPINEQFNGRVTDTVWLAFLTAGLLVLLVACANVANLQLARLAVRSREVALRLAMGATRLRIVRQMLLEGVVLAALGGLAGLGFAIAAVRLLAWSVPASAPLPYWITFTIDGSVLAALVGTCVASALFFGMAPALQGSRASVNDLLKDGGRYGTPSHRARHLTTALLALQFALTLVLLANVSMDFQRELLPDGPGIDIDPAPILSARVTLPAATYGTPEARRRFFEQLEEHMRGAAGIVSFTVTDQLPPSDGSPMRLRLADQPLRAGEEGERVFAASIGARYFETLGVTLVTGRELDADADAPGRESVIINQRLADRLATGVPVIGQRIALVEDGRPDAEPRWRTIVGVVPDLRRGPLTRPMAYLPNAMLPSSAVLLLRTTAAPASMTPLLQKAVDTIDPDLPVYRAVPLTLAQYESSWMGRASSGILRTISTIALVLAVIGLYAVIAQTVSQRTHEIGIRVALGATPRRVTLLVLRRALAYVAVGLAVGLPATYVFAHVFTDSSASPSLTSPANLLPVVGLVVVVSLVACARPAVKAARIHPSAVLRAD